MQLAGPLWALKALGLDYRRVVIYCPYIVNCAAILVGDCYFYRLGVKTVGV